MLKAKLIMLAVKIGMGAIALGLGIWYLSSSIGGDSLTYTSMDNFLTAIGANGDIANANGCFMCRYISEMFGVLGQATEYFWDGIIDHIWLLLVIGFGIFLAIYSGQYLLDAAKQTSKLDTSEKKLDFKTWFDKVWHQAVRVLIAGAFIGAFGLGGTTALRHVTQITITPVMFVGAELGMAASGVTTATQCGALSSTTNSEDVLNPVLQPFMCSIGNLNTIMLAGAAGGFALMNYSALGLGGGALTWVAGLGLVILFLIIGFGLFFQVLSVVMKMIFLVLFLPIFIAAYAFKPVWKLASNMVANTVGKLLVSSAIKIVAISLKIVVLFATVSYAADMFFPGPLDGYSSILPPMMNQTIQNPDARTMSIINTFKDCEQHAIINGEMNGEIFKACFTAHKATVESSYPGAFDFMKDNAWEFLIMMIGLFILYYWTISPKIDALLSIADSDEMFDFGGNIKKLGTSIWNVPRSIAGKLTSNMGG
ncbi:MAG: hypothetical protein J6W40_01525 [Alphaproteobacteria bacterium]|nr:hypothetical protein [Alphaproteobacteria bacterium]